MYSFKTIKERGKKRELTITHNGMWEEWDQHLFLFCYKMILRFKNAQFPVKTTQQLSQMPSLKQWQESFLLTFISAFPPPIPSHFQRTGFIDFFYMRSFIFLYEDSSALFSDGETQRAPPAPLPTSPVLRWVWALFGGTHQADINCLIWRFLVSRSRGDNPHRPGSSQEQRQIGMLPCWGTGGEGSNAVGAAE